MRRLLRGRSRPALTDLYDTERRTFLVRYPAPLIVALALGGLLAFGLSGFLGYADDIPLVARLFRPPWPLFLWFCALLLALQASIFRHPALRGRLVAILTATMISIALVAAFYFAGREILAFLREYLGGQPGVIPTAGGALDTVLSDPWTYTLLNAIILVVFWADTARRWVRRASGLSPNPGVELHPGGRERSRDDLPRMEDLVSGDLIAGGALNLALAALFQVPVIAFLVQFLQAHATITICTLALPGVCRAPGAAPDLTQTLGFFNLVLALVILSLGALVLAFSAVLSGLGAIGGVDESVAQTPALLRREESSTESVSEQVSLTVVNTLRSALDRRIRLALASLAYSLRAVAWPLLVFLATVMLALTSRAVLAYLHSDKGPETIASVLLPSFVWGAVALVAALAAAGLLMFSWRVVDNTLRFLALIGIVTLLTFWLFSFSLWSINQLFLQLGISDRRPYALPGASTALSLVALVVYGLLAWRAARRERAGVGEVASDAREERLAAPGRARG